MRNRANSQVSMSSTVVMRGQRAASPLDFALLRNFFMYFFAISVIIAPFTPDPVAWGIGSAVPWVILRIVGTTTMPAAVAYIFL